MKHFLFFLFLFSVTIFSSFGQGKGYINPAANYAVYLGYNYEIKTDINGDQIGIVTFPDGTQAEEWDFYKGKDGEEFSYPVINGYDIETIIEKHDTYTKEYAVCVIREKGEKIRIHLLEFMEQNGDKIINEVNRGGVDFRENIKINPKLKTNKDLPAVLDWRDKDGHTYIHGVVNQGSCGSCYSFGACATAEGVYNKAMNTYDGNCADFSESYIAWCLGKYGAYSSSFSGCSGANYDYDELLALVEVGVCDETDFPYTGTDPGSCPEPGAPGWDKTQFLDWHRAACLDSTAIKTALNDYGIVDAAVYVTTDFQNYSGDIFSDASTTCPGSPCSYTTTNHAISLVGWGYDSGELYWILRNSWGTGWGEGGYMRIQWESARVACSVAYLEYSTPNPPSITNVTPNSGIIFKDGGKDITITGTYFDGATSVTVGGVEAHIISNTSTQIDIELGGGNYSGNDVIVTVGGSSDTESTTFTYSTRNTIPVGGGTDGHSIFQWGLDGLFGWWGTANFDATKTIEVYSATYTEEIVLNSTLSPTAANPLIIQNHSGDVVIIDATGNNYGLNLSTVDYVQLTGFSVHSATSSNIYLQGDNCEVYYNKVYNGATASGIKLETGTTNNIRNNLIYNNERYAVHIVNSNSNNIENNTTYTNGGTSTPAQDVTLFSDDFETDLSQWTPENWGLWSGGAHSGTLAMGISNESSTTTTSNAFNVSGYTNIEVSVWISTFNSLEANDNLVGQYSFDGGSWTTFVSLSGNNNPYAEYTAGPIANSGGTSYSTMQIRFTADCGNSEYWMVDDLLVIGDEAVAAGNIGSEMYVESGTGTTVENNIFYVKNGSDYYAVQTENGVTISSDYNTYYPNGNANLFNYNGTIDNTGPISANDITSDPDFVTAGTDFHIFSTNDSYHNGEWPPLTASSGTWTTDGSDSPAIDAGNGDTYSNEPANNGGIINQGAYGNTVQASKSGGGSAISWDGSANSNWQTTTNWVLGVVPSSSDDVTIPNGSPNYPVINNGIGTVAVCNNLTIENAASLTIDPDGYMTISGSITNSGNETNLIINSDDTGTGSLIHNTSGGADATVQLYFEASPTQWHMLSSPINNASLSVFPTTNNLYFYDESTDDFWLGNTYGSGSVSGWTAPVGNLDNTLGYLYYYFQTTLNFTGQLNDNTTSNAINISYTNYLGTGNADELTYDYLNMDGWNFIGNPYTSAIDWTVVDAGAANLYDAVYFYDGTNYKSWVSGNDSWDGASTNGGTEFIPAMQGFFVKGNIALGAGGTLNIPASARVHNNQAFWKNDNRETPQDFLRMAVETDGYSDEAIVRFLIPATFEMDNKMDAYKRFSMNDAVPQIYTNALGGTEYSINSIPYFDKTLSIPVKFLNTGKKFTLKFTEFNFYDIKVYLKDNYLNETIEIGLNDSFKLTDDENIDINRFELVFETTTTSVPQAFNTSVVLFPNPCKGTFYLTVGNKASDFNVEITNITGQIVYKKIFENNTTKEINIKSQSRGVYFVKIKFNDNSVVNKKIIVE
ncbi:MAG: T9SS type A sorting domain-containing protein [Bacteroidales bacterium]|nr:T9SS type A sorting domain-containing protein [Bacteroidales bacterium]